MRFLADFSRNERVKHTPVRTDETQLRIVRTRGMLHGTLREVRAQAETGSIGRIQKRAIAMYVVARLGARRVRFKFI